MGKVRGGADQENGVAVYETGDGARRDGVGRGWGGNKVDFDGEIGTRFAESGVGGLWDDPKGLRISRRDWRHQELWEYMSFFPTPKLVDSDARLQNSWQERTPPSCWRKMRKRNQGFLRAKKADISSSNPLVTVRFKRTFQVP